MIDCAAAHQMTDIAPLYALGALSQLEARSFEEHLSEGCAACGAELESFDGTVKALAFSAADVEPPARVRAQLLTRLNESVTGRMEGSELESASNQFVSILAAEGKWIELQEGVLLKRLYVDQSTGITTSLVRMLPGTALPVHRHLGVEQFLVIEGDCNVAGRQLGPGDYHRAEAGSTHETTYTADGTLFLLIAPERYEVLDAR